MKTKTPLERGLELINELVAILRPACERIEIVGSARRKRPEIGDGEIVCIPKMSQGLFAEAAQLSVLEVFFQQLAADPEGPIDKVRINGEKLKKVSLKTEPDFVIEIHICPPEAWGYKMIIHTGPAEFSRQIVTSRQKRTEDNRPGLLPSHLKIKECQWWEGNEPRATPEEEDVFKLLNLEWIPPKERK